jgi:hypothetical protein
MKPVPLSVLTSRLLQDCLLPQFLPRLLLLPFQWLSTTSPETRGITTTPTRKKEKSWKRMKTKCKKFLERKEVEREKRRGGTPATMPKKMIWNTNGTCEMKLELKKKKKRKRKKGKKRRRGTGNPRMMEALMTPS